MRFLVQLSMKNHHHVKINATSLYLKVSANLAGEKIFADKKKQNLL